MDLERMLERCRRDQWSPDDLDWTSSPRPMSARDERAIVQLFTDMVGIEQLASALFREQARRATDPTLRAIFTTFVGDEDRHAEVARRLAAHYDVRRYQRYRTSANLDRFVPFFLGAVRLLSDDVANAYVTMGELILDIALLRSIDDYVDDAMSAQAMRLINRDEARHIAVDYAMVEYYGSPSFARRAEARVTRRGPVETVRAWGTFAGMLFHAQPFIRDVFLTPMELVDPSGARLREAFKRYQQLGVKPGVRDRPFGRFLIALQDAYHHPILGPLLGRLIVRIAGVDDRFMQRLNDPEELALAEAKSYEQLAREALGVSRPA